MPGAINAPPSVWDELNQNVPNYGPMTQSATGDISSLLSGQLSPSTMNNIGNYAASRGVAMGQPNSPLSNLIGMNVTGTTTEGLEQQGLGDYNSLTGTLGATQQNPALLSNIAEENAVNASAPNPQAASQELQSLFAQYMNNPARGTGQYSSFNPSGAGSGGSASGGGAYSQFPMFSGGGNSAATGYANNVASGFGGSTGPVITTGGGSSVDTLTSGGGSNPFDPLAGDLGDPINSNIVGGDFGSNIGDYTQPMMDFGAAPTLDENFDFSDLFGDY